MSEKVRQKIWGTTNPPGQEDPYGNQSIFDRTKQKRQEEDEEDRRKEMEEERAARRPEEADMSNYVQAATWDGLEQVGGFGGWFKENWDPEHRFTAFVPKEITTESEAITAALHRAMVEVLALQEAGVPIGSISNDTPGQDLTMDVKIENSETGPVLQFAESISRDDVVDSLAAQVDETEDNTNPTEAEEHVAADRSDVDPLESEGESYHETAEKTNPTASEEFVAADRSTEDPLVAGDSVTVTYEELFASWGSDWLQVSLQDPAIKFAVSSRETGKGL